MMKKIYLYIFAILCFVYYQIDYKRYFIASNDGKEYVTIWKRHGYCSYIIPGKYYLPWKPHSNYLYVSNQYVGVIFNTFDTYKFKLSVLPQIASKDFDKKIKIYKNKDSLLVEYKILKENENKSIREYSSRKKELRLIYDYRLIDLNSLYGIEILIE